MDLRELGAVEPRSHWYYRAKLRPLRAYFQSAAPAEIVDVGAGSGFFSNTLKEEAPKVRLLQIDTGYETSRGLPERIGPDALVLMMDVLEHAEDDAGLLRDVVKRCQAPCSFFLTVPAFPSLWSPHDEFLGHKRRYRLGELEALSRDCGLRVQSSYYYYGLLLPAAWLKRKLMPEKGSELKPLPGWLDALLDAVCVVEQPLRRLNKLAGLTCVVEAHLP